MAYSWTWSTSERNWVVVMENQYQWFLTDEKMLENLLPRRVHKSDNIPLKVKKLMRWNVMVMMMTNEGLMKRCPLGYIQEKCVKGMK